MRAPPPSLADRVLYRDGLVLVIDKPAGVPVHAGPGGGPNLEAGFDALRYGLPKPPALAHRLDRDTSGCLVLGRHPKALRRLGRLFSEGLAGKTYWAIVVGSPPQPTGTIELALRKESRKETGWKMVVDPEGQKAITDYEVLGRSDTLTWIEFRPRTGRTHQIRVHAAAIGCPVVGDPVYGPKPSAPLHLHARAIRLPLYPAKPPIEVTAPPPRHMLEALRACGYVPSPREGGEKVPSASEADEGLPRATTRTVATETPRSPSSALRAPSPRLRGEKGNRRSPGST